jgi:hypothetical protein
MLKMRSACHDQSIRPSSGRRRGIVVASEASCGVRGAVLSITAG